MTLVWKNTVALFYRTMYMKKNSPLTPFIAYELKKLAEAGFNDVLSQRHIVPDPDCEPINKEAENLGMEKFASIFVLYLIGLVLSLMILVMENLCKPTRSKNYLEEESKFEVLQSELENLAAKYGIDIFGDIRMGWITLKK